VQTSCWRRRKSTRESARSSTKPSPNSPNTRRRHRRHHLFLPHPVLSFFKPTLSAVSASSIRQLCVVCSRSSAFLVVNTVCWSCSILQFAAWGGGHFARLHRQLIDRFPAKFGLIEVVGESSVYSSAFVVVSESSSAVRQPRL